MISLGATLFLCTTRLHFRADIGRDPVGPLKACLDSTQLEDDLICRVLNPPAAREKAPRSKLFHTRCRDVVSYANGQLRFVLWDISMASSQLIRIRRTTVLTASVKPYTRNRKSPPPSDGNWHESRVQPSLALLGFATSGVIRSQKRCTMLCKRLTPGWPLVLLVPLLVFFGLGSFAMPVEPKSGITINPSIAGSQPLLRKLPRVSAPRTSSPTFASIKPALTVTQPLEVRQLSTEELFKAILIHDTLAPPSTRPPPPGLMASKPPRTGWAALELPAFLDYPIFTSPSRLVTFDAGKQPVQLGTNPRDLSEAVRSFAFNSFYVRLNALQPSSAPQALAAVKQPTVMQATRMVTKDALAAQERVRTWAQTWLRQSTRREVKADEVERSLARSWGWWQRGLQEAMGFGYVPVDQMRAKILR